MSSQTAIYYDNKYMQKLYGEQVILKVLKANNNNNTVTIDNRDSNIYHRHSAVTSEMSQLLQY